MGMAGNPKTLNTIAKMPEELLKKLTPEFLETLYQVACHCGWNVDMFEVDKFVEWTYKQAGQEPKQLEEI